MLSPFTLHWHAPTHNPHEGMMQYGYCKFGNFRENLIFANSVKTHLRRKKSWTGHDLPISVNDRVISPIREGLILTKLRICEVSRKLNSRENFRIYSSFRFVVWFCGSWYPHLAGETGEVAVALVKFMLLCGCQFHASSLQFPRLVWGHRFGAFSSFSLVSRFSRYVWELWIWSCFVACPVSMLSRATIGPPAKCHLNGYERSDRGRSCHQKLTKRDHIASMRSKSNQNVSTRIASYPSLKFKDSELSFDFDWVCLQIALTFQIYVISNNVAFW